MGRIVMELRADAVPKVGFYDGNEERLRVKLGL